MMPRSRAAAYRVGSIGTPRKAACGLWLRFGDRGMTDTPRASPVPPCVASRHRCVAIAPGLPQAMPGHLVTFLPHVRRIPQRLCHGVRPMLNGSRGAPNNTTGVAPCAGRGDGGVPW